MILLVTGCLLLGLVLELGKLGSWGAGRLGGWEAGRLGALLQLQFQFQFQFPFQLQCQSVHAKSSDLLPAEGVQGTVIVKRFDRAYSNRLAMKHVPNRVTVPQIWSS
jgi:hypothetical protein